MLPTRPFFLEVPEAQEDPRGRSPHTHYLQWHSPIQCHVQPHPFHPLYPVLRAFHPFQADLGAQMNQEDPFHLVEQVQHQTLVNQEVQVVQLYQMAHSHLAPPLVREFVQSIHLQGPQGALGVLGHPLSLQFLQHCKSRRLISPIVY